MIPVTLTRPFARRLAPLVLVATGLFAVVVPLAHHLDARSRAVLAARERGERVGTRPRRGGARPTAAVALRRGEALRSAPAGGTPRRPAGGPGPGEPPGHARRPRDRCPSPGPGCRCRWRASRWRRSGPAPRSARCGRRRCGSSRAASCSPRPWAPSSSCSRSAPWPARRSASPRCSPSGASRSRTRSGAASPASSTTARVRRSPLPGSSCSHSASAGSRPRMPPRSSTTSTRRWRKSAVRPRRSSLPRWPHSASSVPSGSTAPATRGRPAWTSPSTLRRSCRSSRPRWPPASTASSRRRFTTRSATPGPPGPRCASATCVTRSRSSSTTTDAASPIRGAHSPSGSGSPEWAARWTGPSPDAHT